MQHITKCDCKVNDFFDKFLCLCSNFFFTCISIFMIDFCVNCFLEWNVGFNCSDCLIVYKTMFNLWYNSSISAPSPLDRKTFKTSVTQLTNASYSKFFRNTQSKKNPKNLLWEKDIKPISVHLWLQIMCGCWLPHVKTSNKIFSIRLIIGVKVM